MIRLILQIKQIRNANGRELRTEEKTLRKAKQ